MEKMIEEFEREKEKIFEEAKIRAAEESQNIDKWISRLIDVGLIIAAINGIPTGLVH